MERPLPIDGRWVEGPPGRDPHPDLPAQPAAAALLERIAGGDEVAMRAFFTAFEARVFGFASRMLGAGAEAEEALVDVFEKVWRAADTYDAARGSVSAWVGAIARSTCTDRLRAVGRVNGSLDGAHDLPAGAADPARASETSEWTLRVQGALRALPREQRIALCAAYFDGLSYREVAEEHAAPVGTIKTRIRAGLAGLRAALEPFAREETTP